MLLYVRPHAAGAAVMYAPIHATGAAVMYAPTHASSCCYTCSNTSSLGSFANNLASAFRRVSSPTCIYIYIYI